MYNQLLKKDRNTLVYDRLGEIHIKINNFSKGLSNYKFQKIYPYTIVDNFFDLKTAKNIEKEFPSYSD